MNYKKRPIGLFGGTFDPIHRGHLHVAKEILSHCQLQAIHFIPCRQSPHRQPAFANDQHRLNMLRAATYSNPQFVVNDLELNRPIPSYTIDTLKTLRALCPTLPMCLMIGEDVLMNLNKWLHWQDITKLAHLIIINRPNFEPHIDQWLRDYLRQHEIYDPLKMHEQPYGFIYNCEIKPSGVQASIIRQKLANQENASDMLTPEVYNYIHQHHLYKNGINNKES